MPAKPQGKTPSILLVGDGGTEKTRFAVQAPGAYVYDFDAGLASTNDLPKFERKTFKDLPPQFKKASPEKGFFPWGTGWTKFFDHLNTEVEPKVDSGEFDARFLVIDSLTTLTGLCMNYVLKTGGKEFKAAPTLPDYGSQLRLMETTMEQLAAWPCGLIVTAHIKRDDNLVLGEREYLPLITGQLSGKLGIYFDEVWYTSVQGIGKDRTIKVKTESQGMYKQAKSRNHVPTDSKLNWSVIGPYLGLA